jgi:hypothetical protein
MKKANCYTQSSMSLSILKKSLHELQKARVRLSFCAIPVDKTEQSIYREACKNLVICENELKAAIRHYPVLEDD